MAYAGQIQFFTKEQVLAGTSTTGVPTVSGTDISFLSSDNSINSTSTNFVTSGYAAGMLITITSSGANNGRQYVIQSVAPKKMIVIDGSVLPESAGGSITLSHGYVLYANQGQTDAKISERSWICTVCNQSFPERLIRKFRGKYYCVPNGDYKDIASILKTERARRYKPEGIGRERIVPPIIEGS